MTSSTNSIMEQFLYKEIPKINGTPRYRTIKNFNKMLRNNASSIYSNLGGGLNSLLSLTLLLAVYNNISVVLFVFLVNLGLLLAIVPGMTGAQIASAIEQHKHQIKIFLETQAANSALKSILLATFDNIYFS